MEREVDVAQVLAELGGISTRVRLVKATSRAHVDAALRSGVIVADARDRYALAATDDAVRRAAALSGLLSLTSAALHHGWEVKTVPDQPHVTVPRKRRVSTERRAGVELHRHDVHSDDIVDDIATGSEPDTAHSPTRRQPRTSGHAQRRPGTAGPKERKTRRGAACEAQTKPTPCGDTASQRRGPTGTGRRCTKRTGRAPAADPRPPPEMTEPPPPTKVALVQRQADLACPRCSAA